MHFGTEQIMMSNHFLLWLEMIGIYSAHMKESLNLSTGISDNTSSHTTNVHLEME